MHIQRLILYTHALEPMRKFYAETLGLHMIMDQKRSFSVLVGGTQLEFHALEVTCRYHFAFNVPPGQIESARQWLEARTPILPHGDQSIVEFPNWKARAVYFHDPAGNIVELIARDELHFFPQGEFGRDHFAGVSEIGLAVHDMDASTRRILEETGEPVYWRGGEDFLAAGDVHGLMLFVPADKWDWLPTGEIARTATCQFWASSETRSFMIVVDEGEVSHLQVVGEG